MNNIIRDIYFTSFWLQKVFYMLTFIIIIINKKARGLMAQLKEDVTTGKTLIARMKFYC